MDWRSLCVALVILSGYVGLRAIIYALFPVYGSDDWIVRDTLMDVPRIVGTCISYLAFKRLSSVRRELSLRIPPRLIVASVLLLLIWLYRFASGTGESFDDWMAPIGIGNSAFVAVFEELLFRGLFVEVLKPKLSFAVTSIITSAIFTVYHIQAQETIEWPAIFFTGIILVNMRLAGSTLLFLVALHACIDSAYFFFPFGDDSALLPATALLGGLAIGTFWLRKLQLS